MPRFELIRTESMERNLDVKCEESQKLKCFRLLSAERANIFLVNSALFFVTPGESGNAGGIIFPRPTLSKQGVVGRHENVAIATVRVLRILPGLAFLTST